MNDTTFSQASNSDVLKRFGLKMIMGRAWTSFKHMRGYMAPKNFAEALRKAWSSLRAQINREREAAVQLEAHKARYTGLRDSLSPLNPHRAPKGGAWGKGSSRYLNTVMGA